jgi:hypothetical protein
VMKGEAGPALEEVGVAHDVPFALSEPPPSTTSHSCKEVTQAEPRCETCGLNNSGEDY